MLGDTPPEEAPKPSYIQAAKATRIARNLDTMVSKASNAEHFIEEWLALKIKQDQGAATDEAAPSPKHSAAGANGKEAASPPKNPAIKNKATKGKKSATWADQVANAAPLVQTKEYEIPKLQDFDNYDDYLRAGGKKTAVRIANYLDWHIPKGDLSLVKEWLTLKAEQNKPASGAHELATHTTEPNSLPPEAEKPEANGGIPIRWVTSAESKKGDKDTCLTP